MEAFASAALFSILQVEERDFTTLLGRLDILSKFEKIREILEHRSDARLQQVKDLLVELRRLRPDRNAITHGYYDGSSKRGEHCFLLMADTMMDEEHGRVRKMRAFTNQDLADHSNKTLDLLLKVHSIFDSAKMRELFGGSFRVPTQFR